MTRAPLLVTALTLATMTAATCPAADRQWEKLDRGVVAQNAAGGAVYLSWRLLDNDPKGVAFDVYRGDAKLTAEPIRATTDFLDARPPAGRLSYRVVPVPSSPGGEGAAVLERSDGDAKPGPALVFRIPGDDKTVQKAGIADLDGDGRLDFVFKTPDSNVDPYENYWKPSPGTFTLRAVRHDGAPMWNLDLGRAIEQGIWYSPYVVCDLDGDGRAEIAAKTGAMGADPRDKDGRVMTGPEYLSLFDGRTGKPIARIDWPSREAFEKVNPDPLRAYNYYSRNFLGVAYLDGVHPYLIVERGTYNLMVVRAYRFKDGALSVAWTWDNSKLGREYQGQGAHGIHAADIDGDGKDELVLGSVALDDDGKEMWTTGLGHPDHAYIGDLDPTRPGLEIYYGIETKRKKNGMCMADARTGAILWGFDQPTRHVHGQGLCADLDPRYPGSECYSADTDANKDFAYARVWTAQGQVIGDQDLGGFAPRPVYWDADAQRELIRKRDIIDLDGTRQDAPRVEGNIIAVVDLIGDWREEILTSVGGEFRVYSTTIPAADRRVTLLRDPIYRNAVTHASMAYYQVPTLTYDMASTPPPGTPATAGGR